VLVGVLVGGMGVLVCVAVNVAVGGTGVFLGVFVGGIGVFVYVIVKVAVGGTGVFVGVLIGVSVKAASATTCGVTVADGITVALGGIDVFV